MGRRAIQPPTRYVIEIVSQSSSTTCKDVQTSPPDPLINNIMDELPTLDGYFEEDEIEEHAIDTEYISDSLLRPVLVPERFVDNMLTTGLQ